MVRTRSRLQTALLELATERGLESVSIGEITDRAGVNRSTFYQHYADKDVLLADALDALVGDMVVSPGGTTDDRGIPVELHAYIAHVRDHAVIYREILGEHGSALVTTRLRERLEATIRNSVALYPDEPYPGVPLDVVAAGLSGAAMGVLSGWLRRTPMPSADLAAQWMWSILGGTEPTP